MDDKPLTFDDILALTADLRARVSDMPAAIYVSPELYFDFNQGIAEANSVYWPTDYSPMLPMFFGLPVTIDPDLRGPEWYTVDIRNNIIALHVALPGSDPVEYGTLQRRRTNDG